MNISGFATPVSDRIVWSVSIAVIFLTLPYLVYVLVLVAVPDVEQLRTPKLRFALIALTLVTGLSGVAIGKNHRLFLTCNDFRIAGDEIPQNCRGGRTP